MVFMAQIISNIYYLKDLILKIMWSVIQLGGGGKKDSRLNKNIILKNIILTYLTVKLSRKTSKTQDITNQTNTTPTKLKGNNNSHKQTFLPIVVVVGRLG